MNEELNKKINLLKEQREMILHNIWCYEGKPFYKDLYEKYVCQLSTINSIMVDVINSYPDVKE